MFIDSNTSLVLSQKAEHVLCIIKLQDEALILRVGISYPIEKFAT